MEETCDILAVSTHPDDVELACGGSLILAARKGLRVAVVDLTRGEGSSRGSAEQRDREAAEAARRLGVRRLPSLGLPDTRLGRQPDEAEALVPVIRSLRPQLILLADGADRHPDHVAASGIVRRAVFLSGLARHGNGAPHRVARIAAYPNHYPMQPSLVVDVTEVWEERMAALAAYESQFGSGGGPATSLSGGDFLRFIEARAICHGAMIGARYGEAFRLDGPIGADGLDSLMRQQTSAYRRFL